MCSFGSCMGSESQPDIAAVVKVRAAGTHATRRPQHCCHAGPASSQRVHSQSLSPLPVLGVRAVPNVQQESRGLQAMSGWGAVWRGSRADASHNGSGGRTQML